MLTDTDIRTLEQDPRLRAPVLSLYVNTDRSAAEGRNTLASLRRLVRVADRKLGQRGFSNAAEMRRRLCDVLLPRMTNFLDREVIPLPVVRGAAFFASLDVPDGLRGNPRGLKTRIPPSTPELPLIGYTLPRPVRSTVEIDLHPAITPLLFLLDQYERYAVITADRHHARFFTVFLGNIEALEEFTSDTPARHDQGGWSQGRFQRHLDAQFAAHARRIVTRATTLLHRFPKCRLLLGGDDKMLHMLRDLLPANLQTRVAGTFPLDVHAPLQEILERTLAVAECAERATEAGAVTALREALINRQAVHGLPPTLDALTFQRARALVVLRGFHARGAICQNCAALLPPVTICPHCRATPAPVEDMVEHALERAHREGVAVEFVGESMDLAALGHVGAFLRYAR